MAGSRRSIEHRHLRSAIEFAVLIAAEGQKRKPPLPYPPELKAHFGTRRIPGAALGRLRRVIEADAVFRSRLSHGALPELVDEVGRLWLEHREGWEEEALRVLREREAAAEEDDLRAGLARAERRRSAAEQAAVRARAEIARLEAQVADQREELELLRADATKAADALAEARAELIDVRNEIRHARDREAAAADKLEVAIGERDDARAAAAEFAPGPAGAAGPSAAEIEGAAAAARRLAEQLEALAATEPAPDDGSGRGRRPVRRTPPPLPVGVISTSAEAAEHLVRSGAVVLVDGYNVAKLSWPGRELAGQRAALLEALERLAHRFGTEVTVVFDGADVVGAHAGARRAVRVVFSPAGVTADDVIRDEVRRLPAERAVVVVTNDAEIVRDVRALGAATVPSNALVAIL